MELARDRGAAPAQAAEVDAAPALFECTRRRDGQQVRTTGACGAA
jgi:hypothetical protein